MCSSDLVKSVKFCVRRYDVFADHAAVRGGQARAIWFGEGRGHEPDRPKKRIFVDVLLERVGPGARNLVDDRAAQRDPAPAQRDAQGAGG